MRMLAFGLSVLVYDPYLEVGSMGDLEGKIQLTDLDSLMVESDVVSIHAPLNDETRGMIGRKELELMKETALLLNVARGGIVDEEELARVVKSGGITAAAVDTLSTEPPPPDNPLLGVDKILVTPHIAWYSEESVMDLETMAATQAAQILRGEAPTNLVNRELLC
jgi:D-3-phosphoglycerate dehydrogenase